jgi:hypothetical protein
MTRVKPVARNAIALLVRQLGDLRVLRGVVGDVAEEARTRSFPSPPFDGFGFSSYNYSREGPNSDVIIKVIRSKQAAP